MIWLIYLKCQPHLKKIEPKFSRDIVASAPEATTAEIEQPVQPEPVAVVSDYTEVLNTPISDIQEVSEQDKVLVLFFLKSVASRPFQTHYL